LDIINVQEYDRNEECKRQSDKGRGLTPDKGCNAERGDEQNIA
jgi:hypothetical protein